MITILEPIVTAKMSGAEAALITKLLGLLPGDKPRHEIRIDATRFSDFEWSRLMAIHAAFSDELSKHG